MKKKEEEEEDTIFKLMKLSLIQNPLAEYSSFFSSSFYFIGRKIGKGVTGDKVGHGAKRNHGESVHRTNFIRVNPYSGVDPGAEGC